MHWTPYAVPALVATLLCLGTLPWVWRRRASPGGLAYVGLLICLTTWAGLEVVGAAVLAPEAKLLLARIQFLGVATTPVAFLIFALSYNGWQAWLRRPWAGLLFAIPLVTIAFVLTDDLHGLVWSEISGQRAELPLVVITRGPWFPVHTVYSYALVAGSVLLTLWRLVHAPHHRTQLACVATAPAIVLAFNAAYLSGRNPLGDLDPTPLSFAIGAAILGFALFRYRLFDVVPVARTTLFDAMADAVIVIDEQARVADLNTSARALVQGESKVIGSSVRDLVPGVDALLALGEDDERRELRIKTADQTRVFEARVALLAAPTAGRLLVLRDVSARKQAEEALFAVQEELRRANQELERLANTDELTGLASRRSFSLRLEEEVERARRHNHMLGLLLVDADHFKDVNDTHGHAIGDRVLSDIADVIRDIVRRTDVAARLGGEEFVVLLPETDPAGVQVLADRLRIGVASRPFLDARGEPFEVTVSIGAAARASRGESAATLLARADAALYRAKDAGRNCVVWAEVG
ncbi:MAG: diguanylate cyclase [Proteobacteria bacterium]|nr:diguanylate cyclase [Pseudomonadota bacterium]